MNTRIALLLGLLTFFLISCDSEKEDVEKMFPSDYLFAQRSFPHGVVDLKAYRSALASRRTALEKSSFEEFWISKGPTNLCGRITDIEMPIDDTQKIIAGSASGGVFISENLGEDWRPVFDNESSLSIGDIAISKQNPQLIYVGTGESNAGGGSLAYDGLGVYKSANGGEDWEAIGLEKSGSIGRVVIDPEDDNTLFVAAMGELFANSPDRGIYRTKDGGANWEQVLFRSDSTGGIDLAIHPTNGKVLYAAMWERIRRPYNRQYGGETSGLYRSQDGGDTWEELQEGLPSAGENKGRIGIAISESHPNILYAYYATAQGSISGIFRSDNGGDTWVRKSTENITNVSFIWWFGKIFVHPTDPNDVYVASINMFRSIDGGEEWNQVFTNAHVDHHALYIHPENPEIVINGNDGGVYAGVGPGNVSSTYLNGMSNFQFYTCKIDPNNSEIIYGGAQDNGTNRYSGSSDNWRTILGGDGFRVLVDPNDSDKIYMESQYGGISVSSDGGISSTWGRAGLDGAYNWNTPIAMDPNNSSVLYTGAQQLYRTINQAQLWEGISPSLVNDDNPNGVLTYGSLTTIDVSVHDSQVIYIGTDDGNVWVTKDAGMTYENISDELPERWITAVAHDPHKVSGVYVSVSGFRFGESEAQVFYSSNYGADWVAIGEGLPDIPVNDIVADGNISELIYVATDVGVYVSLNQGTEWQPLGLGMPAVPVTDLDLSNSGRLLAAATFGRGMYTYELPEEVNNKEIAGGIDIQIFPNPTSDRITLISEGKEIVAMRLIDVSGKVLLLSSDNDLDLSHLSDGLYFLNIGFSNGKGITRRVVKE